MIGNILLALLCLLLAALAAALFLPIQARVSYDRGELRARVRFWPMEIPLYPLEKEDKPEKKEKKKKKEKQSKAQKKPRVNASQILYSLEKLPPILGRALRRAGKGIRVAPLKVHLLVAGTDPADTAMLYGKLEAALAAGLPVLHRLVRIREQDIRLFLDFQEEKPDCIADVGVAIRLWDILVIALCAGGSALAWFIGFRKLRSPDDINNEHTTVSAAQRAG